jgi:hypothetical protein
VNAFLYYLHIRKLPDLPENGAELMELYYFAEKVQCNSLMNTLIERIITDHCNSTSPFERKAIIGIYGNTHPGSKLRWFVAACVVFQMRQRGGDLQWVESYAEQFEVCPALFRDIFVLISYYGMTDWDPEASRLNIILSTFTFCDFHVHGPNENRCERARTEQPSVGGVEQGVSDVDMAQEPVVRSAQQQTMLQGAQHGTMMHGLQQQTMLQGAQQGTTLRSQQQALAPQGAQQGTMIQGLQQGAMFQPAQQGAMFRSQQQAMAFPGAQQGTMLQCAQQGTMFRTAQQEAMFRSQQQAMAFPGAQQGTMLQSAQQGTTHRSQQQAMSFQGAQQGTMLQTPQQGTIRQSIEQKPKIKVEDSD